MKPTQTLQPIHWPKKPWQHIQIDIFGEVQAAPHSQRSLVVVHDVHSKWIEIAATSTVTSSAIIQVLKELLTRLGIPEVLQSDNGPQFVSYEFEMLLQKLAIEHHRSALYNPQCNGGLERLNRVIEESLGAQHKEGKTFTDAVRTILQTYRHHTR